MSIDPLSSENISQDHFLLQLHLSATVPLAILEYQQRGGPDDLDYERIRSYTSEFGAAGDAILYSTKPKEKTTEMITKLAEAIATLAFLPGGIKVFGMYFNASGIPDEGHPRATNGETRLSDCMDRLPPIHKTTEEESTK